jgi:hypothetical protein
VIILIGVMATPMVLLPVIQAHAEPPLIDVTLEPGQSRTVTTTVNVPEVPPKLDLVLDVDLSSSYNDNLVVIKEKSQTSLRESKRRSPIPGSGWSPLWIILSRPGVVKAIMPTSEIKSHLR